jgi:hypothetical protein
MRVCVVEGEKDVLALEAVGEDFGADPTKLILRCALRIGSSDALHHVRVLR